MTKRALTLEMLDLRYPQSACIRTYTDGSATEAVRRGGAGIYIQHPYWWRQAEAIPTGLHWSNYKAETETLKHAARIIQTEENSLVVLLTDAKSVLEALTAGKLPQLQEEIQQIRGFGGVLQWIPSHCGISGNEEADRLAKLWGWTWASNKQCKLWRYENHNQILVQSTTNPRQLPFSDKTGAGYNFPTQKWTKQA